MRVRGSRGSAHTSTGNRRSTSRVTAPCAISSGKAVFDFNYDFPGSVTIAGLQSTRKKTNGSVVIARARVVHRRGRGRERDRASHERHAASVRQAILDKPPAYVNLHTSVYPNGAMRDRRGGSRCRKLGRLSSFPGRAAGTQYAGRVVGPLARVPARAQRCRTSSRSSITCHRRVRDVGVSRQFYERDRLVGREVAGGDG